jgi:hypothetical protein
MPRFNLSEADARGLADYFAAANDAQYPYQDIPQASSRYLEMLEREHPEYLDHAWRLISNREACLTCHPVAGRNPSGDPNSPDIVIGPNLAPVEGRLQPEWTRLWLANPRRTIPYTSMPQNFREGAPDPVFTSLFPGTPAEQVTALRDVLMNYRKVFESQVAQPAAASAALSAPAVQGETQ